MATQMAVPPAALFPLPLPAGAARQEQPWNSHSGARVQREAKDRDTIHQLVLSLLPLVRRVALQMRERLPMHVELDDLISTGVLGLMDAVQKFDDSKQVKLEQYARHRIRGAILDGLRGLDAASRDMRRKNKHAEGVYRRLEARLGHAPNDQEMAGGLGISLSRWYKTVLELTSLGVDWLRPLASVGTQESAFSIEDTFPDDNEGHQFEACYRREQRELLQRALGRIPERERLGIDESRVSQLHSSALGRLRKRVKDFISNPPQPALRFAW